MVLSEILWTSEKSAQAGVHNIFFFYIQLGINRLHFGAVLENSCALSDQLRSLIYNVYAVKHFVCMDFSLEFLELYPPGKDETPSREKELFCP